MLTDSPLLTFFYGADGRLTRVTDDRMASLEIVGREILLNGRSLATLREDGSGRLAAVRSAEGYMVSFGYSKAGMLRTRVSNDRTMTAMWLAANGTARGRVGPTAVVDEECREKGYVINSTKLYKCILLTFS